MLYNSFGLGRVGKPGPVDQVIAEATENIDSITAKILLRHSYETMYEIFNHDGPQAAARPLALVAMHPKENYSEYSKLYRTIWRFQHHNVKEMFGLNLVEFLNLPHELVELLFKISFEQVRKEALKQEATLRELTKHSGPGASIP